MNIFSWYWHLWELAVIAIDISCVYNLLPHAFSSVFGCQMVLHLLNIRCIAVFVGCTTGDSKMVGTQAGEKNGEIERVVGVQDVLESTQALPV